MLLAAGELIGQLVPVVPQAQGMQELIYIQWLFAEVSPYLDVLPDSQIGDQIVHLKHIAQVIPPISRQLLRVHFPQGDIADGDLPRIRRINTADDVQQGAFSAAAGSQQHAEIPLLHLHVDALENLDPAVILAKALLDIPYLQKHDAASSLLSGTSIHHSSVSVN